MRVILYRPMDSEPRSDCTVPLSLRVGYTWKAEKSLNRTFYFQYVKAYSLRGLKGSFKNSHHLVMYFFYSEYSIQRSSNKCRPNQN